MPPLAVKKNPTEERIEATYSLAINLFDLTRIPEVLRECLSLKQNLDQSPESVIKVDEDKMDETAVLFVCPLLRAAVLCDMIRKHDRKVGDSPTRVYIRKVEAWTKLSSEAVLTEMVKNSLRMTYNTKVFVLSESERPKLSGSYRPPVQRPLI